ncbi:MAG: hypothetical protein A2X08_17765 [Bacteroidetes bacterium GWA2_32_17]|nr:MAG: hypothetical protein A2X08_17765 [Bacteroidetes bacterium GWA2_32_17]
MAWQTFGKLTDEYNEILKLHGFSKNILAKAASPLHNSIHDLPSTSLRMTGRGNKWSWHPIAIGLKI